MNAAEFRETLQRVGLTQTQLAALLGLSVTTVNRWGSKSAKDRLDVPPYAVAFLRAYELLTPRQRELLAAVLTDPDAAHRHGILTRLEQVAWDDLPTNALETVLKTVQSRARRSP